MMRYLPTRPFIAAVVFWLGCTSASAVDCKSAGAELSTDDHAYCATYDQGAPGDIVAIDIGLEIFNLRDGLASLVCVACFDPNALELLEIVTTPILDDFSVFPVIRHLGVGNAPRSETGEEGVLLGSGVDVPLVESFVGAARTIPLLTVYFRVVGDPGNDVPIRFCDDVWEDFGGTCVRNTVNYWLSIDDQLQALSSRHVDGAIRILDGEPTRTEFPDLPPAAKVYAQAPTLEEARVRFELTGGVAHPGGSIAVDLSITSEFEFTGFTAELDYPASYLRLLQVEERVRPGAVQVNHEMGLVGLALGDSRRRIGAEGERMTVATYHFAVTEAAAHVDRLEIAPAEILGFGNTVRIQHEGGELPFPVSSEVAALDVATRVLKVQNVPTRAGDINLDYRLDVSDAIGMLTHLFSGSGGVECRGAEDFNGDHQFDLSDLVALLNYLFGGTAVKTPDHVVCR